MRNGVGVHMVLGWLSFSRGLAGCLFQGGRSPPKRWLAVFSGAVLRDTSLWHCWLSEFALWDPQKRARPDDIIYNTSYVAI